MARLGIEYNGVFIGAQSYPDRKKPCLVVQRGNEAIIVGTFNNANCVETFGKALQEMLKGGREDV